MDLRQLTIESNQSADLIERTLVHNIQVGATRILRSIMSHEASVFIGIVLPTLGGPTGDGRAGARRS